LFFAIGRSPLDRIIRVLARRAAETAPEIASTAFDAAAGQLAPLVRSSRVPFALPGW
jgi:hypothetical protein